MVTDVIYGWSWRQRALLTVQHHISFHARREGTTKWHQRMRANKGGSERRGENKGATKSNMRALWLGSQMTSRGHCTAERQPPCAPQRRCEGRGPSTKLMQMQLSAICISLMIRQMADVNRRAPSWETRQLAGSGSHFVSDAARCTHSMALAPAPYCTPDWHDAVPL